MNQLVRHLLPLALLALTGCNTVEFQSPPTLPLAACDPVWVGDWKVLETEPDSPSSSTDEQYLRVTAECKRWYWVGFGVDDAGKPTVEVDDIQAEQELGFASTEKHQILALREIPKAPAEPGDKPDGYLLIDYRQDDKTLVLAQVDQSRAARLVIDDQVPGWVEKRDRRADGTTEAWSKEFWVYLFGSPEETRAVLDTHALYGPPSHRLEAVDAATSARLSDAIAKTPPKTKEP